MVKKITSNWISRREEIRLENRTRGFSMIMAVRNIGDKWRLQDASGGYKINVSNLELANVINKIVKLGDVENYVCVGRKTNDWLDTMPRQKKWKIFNFKS